MTTRTDQPAEPRTPLNRDLVLRAAIALADSDGIEALTMRRLGQALGVEAMSLYNHVANKDDLLNGIAELVFGKIALPPDDTNWKTALRVSAISSHDVLRRHPWAHTIMMSATNFSYARLRWMDAVLRTLREGGFSAELTCHAFHALDSHITGFTLWQASIPASSSEELRQLAEEFLKWLAVDEYPYVAEHIQQHIRPPRPNEVRAFEFGLDLILDGLERLRGMD